MARWTDAFLGRKRRKEEDQARLVQREAERIATEGVMEALSHDKKLRRAFKGLITRQECERLAAAGPYLNKRQRVEARADVQLRREEAEVTDGC
jgi:hypothetical protein